MENLRQRAFCWWWCSLGKEHLLLRETFSLGFLRSYRLRLLCLEAQHDPNIALFVPLYDEIDMDRSTCTVYLVMNWHVGATIHRADDLLLVARSHISLSIPFSDHSRNERMVLLPKRHEDVPNCCLTISQKDVDRFIDLLWGLLSVTFST